VKTLFVIIITLLLFKNISYSENTIELDGIYQGENIFVLNPFASIGVGFCIYEVTVNEQIATDEINSSAFEIDLTVFNLALGDKVKIVIKHKNDCTPTIVNPEVLKPKATFETQSISVSKDGTLKWITTGERGEIPFIIEQFKWNKWIKVGTIDGKGTIDENTYTYKVEFNTGLNKFRVKQIDNTTKPKYSSEATYNNLAAKITFVPGNGKKATDKITFSAKTSYEIYDYFGTLKLKGKDIFVDITTLPNGNYFINYDNVTETFEKK